MNDVSVAVTKAKEAIRKNLLSYGLRESANGGFASRHIQKGDRLYYFATVYPGLSPYEIDELETQLPFPFPEQTSAHIPDPIRAFLSVMNGLRLGGLFIGGQYGKITPKLGAPIGLRVFLFETPAFMGKTNFRFGSINGTWASQGSLYLTPTGSVVMVHCDVHLIGMVLDSFASFITEEIDRQLAIHDGAGGVLPGLQHLPGDTDDWERIAEAEKDRRKEG